MLDHLFDTLTKTLIWERSVSNRIHYKNSWKSSKTTCNLIKLKFCPVPFSNIFFRHAHTIDLNSYRPSFAYNGIKGDNPSNILQKLQYESLNIFQENLYSSIDWAKYIASYYYILWNISNRNLVFLLKAQKIRFWTR